MIILVCASTAASAADLFESATSDHLYDRVQIYEDPGTNDSWFARAEVTNVLGVYDNTETELTSEGAVSIQYTTTLPSARKDINSADEACVVGLPDGIIAIPECVSVLEQEKENIYLYKYLGG
jgi:hypothetical protein